MKTVLVFLLLVAGIFACPNNCNDCDPSGNICFACGEGFELSVTGQCVNEATIDKCILYGPTNQCFVCQPTYSLDNNGNCLKNGSPCLMTDPANDAICAECGFGTVLNNNGLCEGAINCGQPENPCTSCAPGFVSAGSNCMDMSGNCMDIGANGVCAACNDGYVLNGYTCVESQLKIYACYIWNWDQQKCLSCKSGYNIYLGHCLLPS